MKHLPITSQPCARIRLQPRSHQRGVLTPNVCDRADFYFAYCKSHTVMVKSKPQSRSWQTSVNIIISSVFMGHSRIWPVPNSDPVTDVHTMPMRVATPCPNHKLWLPIFGCEPVTAWVSYLTLLPMATVYCRPGSVSFSKTCLFWTSCYEDNQLQHLMYRPFLVLNSVVNNKAFMAVDWQLGSWRTGKLIRIDLNQWQPQGLTSRSLSWVISSVTWDLMPSYLPTIPVFQQQFLDIRSF